MGAKEIRRGLDRTTPDPELTTGAIQVLLRRDDWVHCLGRNDSEPLFRLPAGLPGLGYHGYAAPAGRDLVHAVVFAAVHAVAFAAAVPFVDAVQSVDAVVVPAVVSVAVPSAAFAVVHGPAVHCVALPAAGEIPAAARGELVLPADAWPGLHDLTVHAAGPWLVLPADVHCVRLDRENDVLLAPAGDADLAEHAPAGVGNYHAVLADDAASVRNYPAAGGMVPDGMADHGRARMTLDVDETAYHGLDARLGPDRVALEPQLYPQTVLPKNLSPLHSA